MSATRSRPPAAPKYLRHTPTNQAYVYVYEEGKRRQIYLGTWASQQSYQEFRRIAGLHLQGIPVCPTRANQTHSGSNATIGEMCARFLVSADKRYRDKDGIPTGGKQPSVHAMVPLLRLYRDLPANEFDINCLLLVREEMEAQQRKQKRKRKTSATGSSLCRRTINDRITLIRSVFKRGVTYKLVPANVWDELRALEPLAPGQTEARETKEIPPVPEEDMRAVLPHLPPTLAAMIEVQWLCAARPGEICQMRPMDIDRAGDVWFFKPRKHKNEHRGHSRTIRLGEKAQSILGPFLLRPKDWPMFSPKEAEQWRPHFNGGWDGDYVDGLGEFIS